MLPVESNETVSQLDNYDTVPLVFTRSIKISKEYFLEMKILGKNIRSKNCKSKNGPQFTPSTECRGDKFFYLLERRSRLLRSHSRFLPGGLRMEQPRVQEQEIQLYACFSKSRVRQRVRATKDETLH